MQILLKEMEALYGANGNLSSRAVIICGEF